MGKTSEFKLDAKLVVPFRLYAFVSRAESKVLEPLLDEFAPEAPKALAAMERGVRSSRRIVKGRSKDGKTFEYRLYGEGLDEDPLHWDVEVFYRNEFPGTASEYANLLPEGEKPIEFVMTARVTALLFHTWDRKGSAEMADYDGSRLLVRVGATEAVFLIHGQRPADVAGALLAVEDLNENARRWLKPVADEIAECNMLTPG